MTATEHMQRLMISGHASVRCPITLRWEVSPHAVRHARLPAIAAMNGQAEKITRASLEWHIDDSRASARLLLELGEDDLILPLESINGRWLDYAGDGFEHADFGGLLRVTLRHDRLVWARTSILEHTLGLRGGVYEGPCVCP